MCVRSNGLTVLRRGLVLYCAFLSVPVIAADEAAPESDHDLIQGCWSCTYGESRGKEVRSVFGGYGRTFNKDKVEGGRALFWLNGTYVIRPEKSPKEIDIMGRSGFLMESKKLRLYGIYRIEGDKFTICESPTKRPTEFRTAPRLDWTLREYTRWVYVVDPDLEVLAGNWRVVRSVGRIYLSQVANRVRHRNGWIELAKPQNYPTDKPLGINHGQAHVVEVNGMSAYFRDKRGKKLSGFAITIDSAQVPKRINVQSRGMSMDGIYLLDGDTLTITLQAPRSWRLLLERK